MTATTPPSSLTANDFFNSLLGAAASFIRAIANDVIRQKVGSLAAIGVPQDNIAKLTDCDPKTLRKHFRDELDRGG
jgi:hypothetical protein